MMSDFQQNVDSLQGGHGHVAADGGCDAILK
jgi:hypothetical protein